jgi:hypothetical protein
MRPESGLTQWFDGDVLDSDVVVSLGDGESMCLDGIELQQTKHPE